MAALAKVIPAVPAPVLSDAAQQRADAVFLENIVQRRQDDREPDGYHRNADEQCDEEDVEEIVQ